MIIEKLGTAVAMESFQGKWNVAFDILDSIQDANRALSPSRPVLGPGGQNVRKRKRPNEFTGNAVTTMGYCVSFNKAWLRDIPVMSSDWNLVAQECSRPGHATPFS